MTYPHEDDDRWDAPPHLVEGTFPGTRARTARRLPRDLRGSPGVDRGGSRPWLPGLRRPAGRASARVMEPTLEEAVGLCAAPRAG